MLNRRKSPVFRLTAEGKLCYRKAIYSILYLISFEICLLLVEDFKALRDLLNLMRVCILTVSSVCKKLLLFMPGDINSLMALSSPSIMILLFCF
jgi:hypothetical protein